MDIQRETARKARGGSKYMGADETVFHKIGKEYHTEFVGYETLECKGTIDYIAAGDELVESADINTGEIFIVSDKTPFYAESGGQVGDTGEIITETATVRVLDTQKAVAGKTAHKAVVVNGTIKAGDKAIFKVDAERRAAIMRNHSCAHLLQAALREVLGEHVHQAGQLVDEHRLRFDFSHFAAVTSDELAQIEKIVNKKIMEALPVTMVEMSIEEAKKLGAMALFGEKYGATVRVVSEGDFSVEFCGGTHVDNTSKIAMFKIISENSVSAGVRRIEAVTGTGVLELMNENIAAMNKAAAALKAPNASELVNRAGVVMSEIKALQKENSKLLAEISKMRVEVMVNNAAEVNGVKLITAKFEAAADELRAMGDKIREAYPDMIAVLANVNGTSGQLMAACGKDAVAKGAHAGRIVKEVSAVTGGKGGGRPDSAMAGIGDVNKLEEAFSKTADIVSQFVK